LYPNRILPVRKITEDIPAVGNGNGIVDDMADDIDTYDDNGNDNRNGNGTTSDMINKHIVEYEISLTLANLHIELNNYDIADRILTESGQSLLVILGDKHQLVADSMVLYAKLCSAKGLYTQSSILYTRGMHIYDYIYGKEHPILATTLLLESKNMLFPGYYDDSQTAEGLCLSIRLKIYDSNSIYIGQCLHLKGLIFYNMKKYYDSIDYYEKALPIYYKAYGENSCYYSIIYSEYVNVKRCLNDINPQINIESDSDGNLYNTTEDLLNKAIIYLKSSYHSIDYEGNGTIEKYIDITGSPISNHLIAISMLNLSIYHMNHGKADESLLCLEGEIYPCFNILLGQDHPISEYVRGLIALNLQILYKSNSSQNGTSSGLPQGIKRIMKRPETIEINIENSNDVIDDVLTYLDNYDSYRSPFTENHPYIEQLGGYHPNSHRDNRQLQARNVRLLARTTNLTIDGNSTVNGGNGNSNGNGNGSFNGGDDFSVGSVGNHSIASFVDMVSVHNDVNNAENNPRLEAMSPTSTSNNGNIEKNNNNINNEFNPNKFHHASSFDGERAKTINELTIGLKIAIEKKDYGYYIEAKDLLEDVLKARRRLELTNSSTIILTRLYLSDIWRCIGNYTACFDLLNKTYDSIVSSSIKEIENKMLLELHCYILYTDYYRNICKYKDMLIYIDKCNKIKNILEKNNDNITYLDDYNLLIAELKCCEASYLLTIGNYNLSQDIYNTALTIRKAILGYNHYKVASCLCHLGRVAMHKSDYILATKLLHNSLEIRLNIFSKYHPSISSNYLYLGQLNLSMGNYSRSGNYFELSLEGNLAIFAKTNEKHITIANSLYGLGQVISAIGYPSDAQDRYDEVLAIYQDVYNNINIDGSSIWHYNIIKLMKSIALNHEIRGNYKNACDLLEKVIFNLHMLFRPISIYSYRKENGINININSNSNSYSDNNNSEHQGIQIYNDNDNDNDKKQEQIKLQEKVLEKKNKDKEAMEMEKIDIQYLEISTTQLQLAKINIYLNNIINAEKLLHLSGVNIMKYVGYNHRPSNKQKSTDIDIDDYDQSKSKSKDIFKKGTPLLIHGPSSALAYYVLGLYSNFKGQYSDANDCYDKSMRIWLCLLGYTKNKNYNINNIITNNNNSLQPTASFDEKYEKYINDNNFWLDDKEVGIQVNINNNNKYYWNIIEKKIPNLEGSNGAKSLDISIPEYMNVLEAKSMNMSINGPGYIIEALDLCNRAYNIRLNLYIKDNGQKYYNENTGCFIWNEDLDAADADADVTTTTVNNADESNSHDVLNVAHGLYLKARLQLILNPNGQNSIEIEKILLNVLKIFNDAYDDDINCHHSLLYGHIGECILLKVMYNSNSNSNSNNTGGIRIGIGPQGYAKASTGGTGAITEAASGTGTGTGTDTDTNNNEMPTMSKEEEVLLIKQADEYLSKGLVLRRRTYGDVSIPLVLPFHVISYLSCYLVLPLTNFFPLTQFHSYIYIYTYITITYTFAFAFKGASFSCQQYAINFIFIIVKESNQ
jgi:hypothetical protein